MPLCKIHLTQSGKGILHDYQCQSSSNQKLEGSAPSTSISLLYLFHF